MEDEELIDPGAIEITRRGPGRPRKEPDPEPTPVQAAPPPMTVEDAVKLIQAANASRPDPSHDLRAIAEGIAQGTQKALKPENAVHPYKSAFSYPEGDIAKPKPKFWVPRTISTAQKVEREVWFCGYQEREERLGPVEIDLYNRVTKPGFYGPRKDWEVRIIHKGDTERLWINVPHKSVDDRMTLPNSLAAILHEMVYGPDATELDAARTEIAALQEQLAAR